MNKLREAAQAVVQCFDTHGFVLEYRIKALRDALAEEPKIGEQEFKFREPGVKIGEQEPAAWMREGWGSDCGPYVEFYLDNEMGCRDREGWTPLFAAPHAAGWRRCAEGQGETQHCGMLEAAVRAERKAICRLVQDMWSGIDADRMVDAILERGRE